jgi:type VI secretion system lysozyme-like protein
MADPQGRLIAASIFDRLTDYDPRNSREVAPSEGEQVRSHKESVARDLTSLLNTRRSQADIPEEFVYTRESLAAYGVEDFTTAPMDRESIRRAIERTVRIFEPRLSRVQVVLVEGGDFTFSFRILGMLRIDAGLEPVVYDADLPKESRRFRVIPSR